MLMFILLFTLVVSKPIFVLEFIRHGARSPLRQDQFFPYTNWKAYGELTAAGERQHYLLGRLRRSQYIEKEGLLPEDYDSSLIYARSSDVRRTMMSLQSYLFGLYPSGLNKLNQNQLDQSKAYLKPRIELTINKDIINQLGNSPNLYSIPIHPYEIVKSANDHMLLFSDCPFYRETMNKYMKDKYSEVFNKYNPIWKSLTGAYNNITMDKLKGGTTGLSLCDFLLCADSDGVRPGRVTDEVITECGKIIGEVQRDRVAYNKRCIQASTKPFAIEIINWMEKVINKTTKVKYVIYGAHDVTLSRLLVGLRAVNSTIAWDSMPPFAANILFELSDNGDNAKELKVFFDGDLILKDNYKNFKSKFETAGDVKVTYKEACKATTEFEPNERASKKGHTEI